MKHKYAVTGLDCPNCAGKLAEMIQKEDGIDSAKINFLTEKLIVESELDSEAVLTIAQKTAKAFSRDVEIFK